MRWRKPEDYNGQVNVTYYSYVHHLNVIIRMQESGGMESTKDQFASPEWVVRKRYSIADIEGWEERLMEEDEELPEEDREYDCQTPGEQLVELLNGTFHEQFVLDFNLPWRRLSRKDFAEIEQEENKEENN